MRNIITTQLNIFSGLFTNSPQLSNILCSINICIGSIATAWTRERGFKGIKTLKTQIAEYDGMREKFLGNKEWKYVCCFAGVMLWRDAWLESTFSDKNDFSLKTNEL